MTFFCRPTPGVSTTLVPSTKSLRNVLHWYWIIAETNFMILRRFGQTFFIVTDEHHFYDR